MMIGKGGSAEVFKGKYGKEDVVVKCLIGVDHDDFESEVRFLHKLKHRNIVEFKAVDF